jgi:hypothetical protein
MKKLIAVALLCLGFVQAAPAATLTNAPGPFETATYNYSWTTVQSWWYGGGGYTSVNVAYDAATVNVGSPGSSYPYTLEIRVYAGGSLYSTQTVPIQAGASRTVFVPSYTGHSISFWAVSGQPYGANYKKIRVSNVVVTN